MPTDYKRYPKEWKKISQRIRFERAKGACEACGAVHLQPHPHYEYRVVLACCHKVHDLKKNDDANLLALCQTCHLKWDRTHHSRSRKFGKYHLDAQIPLSMRPYALKPGIRYKRGTQLTLFP